MAWQGVEIEIQVPCAEGQTHPVRLRFTGWGEYEVAYNPCEERLGPVFARMARCTHYLHEEFPEAFRRDTNLKRRLVEALRATGAPAVPVLIQALGDSDWWVHRAACEALGELGDPQAVPALSVLSHAGEDAARNALQTLGHPALDLPQAVAQVAAQGAWGVLIRVLTNEKVREAVVGLGTPAVPALSKALRDRNGRDRHAAAEALVKIGTPALPALISALGDDSTREVAWEALVRVGAAAVPALIQALGDSNKSVRRAAVEALGKLGDPQAVPALIQALGDSEVWVRDAACWALGKIGDPQAVPALSVLAHAGENAARSALQQLGHLPLSLQEAVAQVAAQGAWGVLMRALPNHAVREAVVGLGAPAVPALIQALGDSEVWVRDAACWALGAIGDPQAVPALQQLQQHDRDYTVRQAAWEAIQQINAKQARKGRP